MTWRERLGVLLAIIDEVWQEAFGLALAATIIVAAAYFVWLDLTR